MEQAKAHLTNNDPESAMRLLKKANDLSRGNQELQGKVYFEMAKTSALADRDSVAATFAIQALESNPQLYNLQQAFSTGFLAGQSAGCDNK